MKTEWRRNLAAFLAVVLILTAIPLPSIQVASAASGVGKTTAAGVYLRKKATTDADYWFRVPENYVCAFSETTTDKRGITWYKVQIQNPESGSGNTYVGFFHGSFYRELTDEEAAEWEKNPVNQVSTSSSTTTNTSGAIATGQVTNGGVNVRQQPSLKSASLFKLDKGVVVELLSLPSANDADPWYNIRYDNHVGYIQGPFIRVLSYGSLQTGSAVVTAAPAQTAVPADTTGTKAGEATAAPEVTVNPDTSSLVPTAVTLILSSVHLRETPGGKIWEDWEERGATLSVNGAAVQSGGYTWYPVIYKNRKLYVRGDCVQVTYSNGTVVNTIAPVVTAQASASGSYGSVTTTKAGVNLRLQPEGSVITQVKKNQTYAVIASPQTVGKYTWYYVQVGSVKGYLRSDCVKYTSSGSSSVTSVPATTSASSSASSYGYIVTTKTGVNVRSTPGGSSFTRVDINTVWPMTGATVDYNKYTWYPVNVNGSKGYIRGDCCYKLSDAQVQSYLSGQGIGSASSTPITVVTSNHYVQTTSDKVYLRAAASQDSNSIAQVDQGTVLAFNSTTTSGNVTWYHVIYNGSECWIHGSYVKEMTDAEYQQYIQTQNPSTTPQTEVILGYIKTVKTGINLRTEPAGKTVIGRVGINETYAYSVKTTASGYNWYLVKTSIGTGYLRSDCVQEISSSTSTTTNAPAATPISTGSSSSGVQVEASYSTLKKGSTGSTVKNLVTELIAQGYYSGSVTSSYTTAVEDAVKAFQKAKNLTVDGIAGASTQHALYGTVPIGASDTSNLSMTIYPAEKIDWYTGGIQDLIPRGSNFKVYDVKTGIVWWAHRWAGGSHADIETLTAADTARLCQIYGVTSASQITAKTHWQRRPCLITVGTRTFACSLYGVPHNAAGDTIKDNNMTGQICLHFTNSRTHDSNKVDTYHTEAIQYAWEHAPNGHK